MARIRSVVGRKYTLLFLVVVCTLGTCRSSYAQAQELQQLALNIEKLAQFKAILSDMKDGYKILTGGYKTVKDLSQGNFSLHKVFLDGLMEVSPTVKKYKRIGDIVNYQVTLLSESKKGLQRFAKNKQFTVDEIKYFEAVYGKVLQESLQNLDELLMVITAKSMRMTDEERLTAIDRIYLKMENKLEFIAYFNNSSAILLLQRQKEYNDVQIMRPLYELNH
ncbi:hypothetical protein [Flavobacterium sp. TAB 87]|uniref:hypothetical protein n=1 Tax=Flavobacterium sp. TAB 87 TaxID=1729581 RepID=UPI00076CE297|nr:hypothetical protein [Flavobacterium sp. TAB 87]KVV16205.1 hypothetical protein AP058_00263 [Flavobacterium sp. TAB 87]